MEYSFVPTPFLSNHAAKTSFLLPQTRCNDNDIVEQHVVPETRHNDHFTIWPDHRGSDVRPRTFCATHWRSESEIRFGGHRIWAPYLPGFGAIEVDDSIDPELRYVKVIRYVKVKCHG